MRRILSCWVWLGLFTAACTGGEAEGGAAVLYRDSADVRLIENRGGDRSLEVTLVRGVDLAPPDSALTPVPWGVAADPETGRVFAADGTSPRVVIFDDRGAYVGTYGREGDGPGEFRDATAVALDEDGVLTVWDTGRGVVSRWSREGALLREDPVPVSYWGHGLSVHGSGLVTVTIEQAGLSMIQRLVLATSDRVATIYELPVEFGMMRLAGMEMPAPKIFMPSVVWTARGDTLFVLKGPEYRIDRYQAGAWAASLRRPLAPIRTTAEMAAATLELPGREFVGFMERTGLTAHQIVNAVGYEETVSPVQSLRTDPKERLWVTRTRDGSLPGPVDLFDRDGRYLGTLEAEGIPVAFPTDSSVVLLRQDGLGVPVLTLYDLEV